VEHSFAFSFLAVYFERVDRQNQMQLNSVITSWKVLSNLCCFNQEV